MSATRRLFLQRLLAMGAAAALARPALAASAETTLATKPIPSSGEQIPVVGLGTWITFNVGADPDLENRCADVMAAFFQGGGRLIDSSPMYGSSQPTIGYGLRKLGFPNTLLSAEKVWISNAASGPGQIEQSRKYWGVPHFDLVQVHNILSWERHLETLFAMKAAGKLRYVGITTSEGRRHAEIERILQTQPIDTLQLTYNALDREPEARLLPLAQERGIAVIVNRPFRQGDLVRQVEKHPLPGWAADVGASSWAQLLLKFVVSHPAVTCAIPATTSVEHMRENLRAGSGAMPDEAFRRRIADHVRQL